MTNPAPEVIEIEARASKAKVKMGPVLKQAGVPASTWWRWREGGVEPRVGTIRKVRHALDDLIAANGNEAGTQERAA